MIPRALWACAAVGFLNAAIWALLTPAFWVPDEPVHVGYAQYLAETGHVPSRITSEATFSHEEDLAYSGIGFTVHGRPSYDSAQARATNRAMAGHVNRSNPGAAGYAVNNPPLYYVLEAVPYRAFEGASFWDRLLAMRLLSAVWAGLIVALTFLLARELLPGSPQSWVVAALAVAFQPLLGFIAGGVNNDSLVWVFGAAVLLGVTRALRRGLTPALGAAIGAALLAGVLTKPAIYGLLPGVALALILAIRREAPESRRRALAGAATAVAVLAVFGVGWLAASHLAFDRPTSTATAGFSATGSTISVRGQLAYLWQSFFPRLPFMQDQFTHTPHYLLWDSYFKGFVGRFGWFEFGFAPWANYVGLAIVSALVVLAAAAVARVHALRRHWPELLTYAAMLVGMLIVAGVAGYRYRADSGVSFEQTRYLFIVLPLWGLVVAVAARGAGRAWTRALGSLFVVLAIGHAALAMLLAAHRFYG